VTKAMTYSGVSFLAMKPLSMSMAMSTHTVLQHVIPADISDKLTASIIKMMVITHHPDDGGSKLICNTVSMSQTTYCSILEDNHISCVFIIEVEHFVL
jgi:hypothetical protein